MSETVTLYKCDKCKKLIPDPKGGLVVHGNIYVADPNDRGGLIGNNFPDSKEDGYMFSKDAVKESVYCVPCFLNTVLPDSKLTQSRGFFDDRA